MSVGGWVFTTWLKIKNGYPLETSWGTPLHPNSDRESAERIKLLTTENAQLRAEIGSLKDRLETVERIVTDEPSRLEREINSLTSDKRRPRMMGPGEVMIALIAIALPIVAIMYMARSWFRYREKKLEVEAGLAAEKAAQYASRTMELEQRVRVLEQIVTDGGAQTAAQIEALRDKPLLTAGDKV